MPKRKSHPASVVLYLMGMTVPAETTDGKKIRYGRKAVFGQYTQEYTAVVELPEGRRHSKGREARHERDNGKKRRKDLSAVINARRAA